MRAMSGADGSWMRPSNGHWHAPCPARRSSGRSGRVTISELARSCPAPVSSPTARSSQRVGRPRSCFSCRRTIPKRSCTTPGSQGKVAEPFRLHESDGQWPSRGTRNSLGSRAHEHCHPRSHRSETKTGRLIAGQNGNAIGLRTSFSLRGTVGSMPSGPQLRNKRSGVLRRGSRRSGSVIGCRVSQI